MTATLQDSSASTRQEIERKNVRQFLSRDKKVLMAGTFSEKEQGGVEPDIRDPLDVIKEIDKTKCKEGMTLLVTETTGWRFAFFRTVKGEFKEEQPDTDAMEFIKVLRSSCEASKVSAIFAAGVGGSARAGVTKNPIKLTKAVHEGKVSSHDRWCKALYFSGRWYQFPCRCGEDQVWKYLSLADTILHFTRGIHYVPGDLQGHRRPY